MLGHAVHHKQLALLVALAALILIIAEELVPALLPKLARHAKAEHALALLLKSYIMEYAQPQRLVHPLATIIVALGQTVLVGRLIADLALLQVKIVSMAYVPALLLKSRMLETAVRLNRIVLLAVPALLRMVETRLALTLAEELVPVQLHKLARHVT